MKINVNLTKIIPEDCSGSYGTLEIISDIRAYKINHVGMIEVDFEHADYVGVKTKASPTDKSLYLRMHDFKELMKGYNASTPKEMLGKQVIGVYAPPKTEDNSKHERDLLIGFLISKGSLEVRLGNE